MIVCECGQVLDGLNTHALSAHWKRHADEARWGIGLALLVAATVALIIWRFV